MSRNLARVLFCLGAIAMFLPASTAVADNAPVAILIPGARGAVPSDFLIRNRARFKDAGIRTVVATSAEKAASAARAEHSKGNTVVLVGMSRGTLHLSQALANGAPASRVVFVSGNFVGVMKTLGSPGGLPPALVVHHQGDRCRMTPPGAAQRFSRWADGKARLVWIDTKGRPSDPCGPRGAHGFYMNDSAAVSAIIAFIRE
jgi:hypothetical protein